jgi:2-oxoglutarate ferredoxin oxidoreductase subunit delta
MSYEILQRRVIMGEDEPKSEVLEQEQEVSDKEKPKKEKYVYDGKTPPLNIFLHWCKACNICIAFCPRDVLEPDRDGKPVIVHPEKCTQCAICWLHCPDFAITSTYK